MLIREFHSSIAKLAIIIYPKKKKLIAIIRLVHNNVTVIEPHDSQFCVCTREIN